MKKILLILLVVTLNSCATFNFTPEDGIDTELRGVNSETRNIFLIGDTGGFEKDGSTSLALRAMQENFKYAGEEDVLLFLGDNIYPKGFPTKNGVKEQKAKEIIQSQTDVAKTFPGRVIFIPGNHDWYSGVKGLKKQEKFVEKALGKNTFLPEKGCPIEKVKLDDDTILLIVDSHWYITNWNRHPTINDNCEIKTRSLFLEEFRDEIKKARGKTTLVAIHHPLFTNGSHGGQYSFIDFIKPLPLLGNLKNLIRSTSGISTADISNKFYFELTKNLIAAAQQNENVVFRSEEHTSELQSRPHLVC